MSAYGEYSQTAYVVCCYDAHDNVIDRVCIAEEVGAREQAKRWKDGRVFRVTVDEVLFTSKKIRKVLDERAG